MKQHLSITTAALALSILLCPGALRADVLVPLSPTWGEYDYSRYHYGSANGNLVLSRQSSSGFTALVNASFVDLVNNGTGAIGSDGAGEGPQARPAVFQEFPALDLSHPGQKATLTFDIQFHNVMKVTDKRFRFGLGNTNSNATVYLMVDTGVASGGAAQFRPDPYMTDVTGITVWDFVSTPFYPWTYTADGYGTSPTLTNLNSPIEPLGPNNGYVSGILSHFASSGGNSQAAFDNAPNGNINGLGADASTLHVVHSFKYSFQRTNDGSGAVSINAGNGLTMSCSWSNSAGPEVKSATTPLYNDGAGIPANGGPLDQIGLVAFNFMDNDIFTNGAAGGSYTISNLKIIYESLSITNITANPDANTLQLIWTSTPYDEPTAQYSIESTSGLAEPIVWTPVGSAIASQGDFTTNTLSNISADGPIRFYRVRKL